MLARSLRPFAMVAAMAACIISPALPAHAQGRAALVGVDEVRVVEMTRTEPVLGRIVARQGGTISALVSGPLDEMMAHVGDRVAAKQVLARISLKATNIEKQLAEANLAEARAEVKTAQAQLEAIRTERTRTSRLRGSAAFSQARLDDLNKAADVAAARVVEAETRIARAEAELAGVELKIFYSEVRAPYDGVITMRHVDRGTYLQGGAPVFEILNDTALEVEVDVPQALVADLDPGRAVTAHLADGSRARLQVRATIPQENALTRTRAVRFEFIGEPPRGLAGGASITVDIPKGESRDVLSVHKDAVITSPQGRTVYVVADGKANIRPVEIGDGFAGRFVVLSGLQAGESVVIRGNERLMPEQDVTTGAALPAAAEAAQ